MRHNTLIPLLVLAGLLMLAAACGPVAPEDGVGLATVPVLPTPTPTPLPAGAAGALPNTASAAFIGMAAGFNYPADWETQTGTQYTVAYQPDLPYAPQQVGAAVFIAGAGVSPDPVAMARRAYHWARYTPDEWIFHTDIDRYAVATRQESAERLETFTWAGRPAAVAQFALDMRDIDPLMKLHVAVQIENDRFAVFWASGYAATWADFAPVVTAILETATLDGEPLPAFDVREAVGLLLEHEALEW